MTDGPQADVQVNRIIPLRQALDQVEAQLIHMTFQEYPSTYKAAKVLGISQSGASRKYLKYQKQDLNSDPKLDW